MEIYNTKFPQGRLGNPKKQDFHKCLNPSGFTACTSPLPPLPYNQEERKEEYLCSRIERSQRTIRRNL
jgi:hypothetical protein